MATFQVAAPEKFDFCKPETWTKWIQRFDRFRSASGLEEKAGATQVNSLIYTMGPEADDIFASFDLSEENKKKYAKVKEQFDKYFIVRRNVIFERAKFNKRKQDDDEGVESFVTSLYTLTEHCGYNDLRQEMIRDRIVVGIKDSNLSLKMQLDPELTLKKATDMARQSESVKKQQAIMRCDNPNSNVDAVKSKFNKTKFAGCQRCGNRQYHPREKCPAKGAKCYKCSNIGHFAKSCKTGKTVESVSVNSDSEGFLGTINTVGDRPWTTKLFIRKKEIDFKIDTGADVTVISDSDLNGINSIELMKANKRLSGPGNTNLNVVGKFQCMLETKDKFSVQDIYVVKGLSKPLLGRPAIQALGIIDKVNVSSVNASSEANNYYRGKYPKIFNGLGKTKWTYTIALGPDAKPFALSTPRRVPLPLMDKVKAELTRMEKLGVISKVDEPTEWCAGMVVVPKSNGDVRICIDFTKLNESVKRENYPLPAVEESLAKLANARMFTKLDANSSFWQTNLAEESRPLTTFITPFGRETVEGYQGVLCHMDDVLVFGSSQEEHDERLEKILEAIGKAGLTLNEKCEFSKPSVKFLGQIVDASGCRSKTFLGMVNQLNKFSCKVTELTKPLRELLKTHNAWHWGIAQETAFTEIKNELASSGTLGHYDPNKDTVVSADASSFGLGAVIRQKHGEILKPVAYASRSMTDTEQRYAQIEKRSVSFNLGYYDRRHRARPFSKVKTNDRVWVKDQKRQGIIKAESNEPRSYIIETDSGEIRRNRRHFSNFPEKPDTKISKNTFETIPDEIPIYNNKLEDNQTDQSDKSDLYVTKSGRISKPPDKLDL
ncbi:unnamed protein product [Mytilus coruscus]|uniref:CCHC-type domain-containing protein n=1 Tax=Mytilus coruscus TaxID=42192 RepID=A0A6J8AGE4_MYTCO|nr:unnamed protein product [Mytilus coruscus]